MTILNKLVGKKIVNITYSNNITFSLEKKTDALIESPTTFLFEDYTLVIDNPFIIKGTDADTSLKILENLTLIDCNERTDRITLTLEGNIELIIDLRRESFKGPEALSLYGPNNLIVVWN
jgi:hypothetical protein